MTLIVYKDGELIADHRVVSFKDRGSIIKESTEYNESKIVITPDKHFAYVYDNDQDENNADIILMALRLHECGKPIDLLKEFKFEKEFILIVMSAKRAYRIQFSKEDGLLINYLKSVYISHNQNFDFYTCLRLTATEIYECLAYNQQYCINGNRTLVNKKDLVPNKKGKS